VLEIDHVQLAIPPHSEDQADAFYVSVLGFTSVPKPPVLAARGGRWYELGRLKVHLGVDASFAPSAKAHVAFRVTDYGELVTRLVAAGHEVEPGTEIPGVERSYTWDPFGNRLELIRA
jgi:catechol 2,3-dioxygenase-like lactoylglutathione lyase family enzyme